MFLDFPGDSFDAGVTFWRTITGYGLSPSRGTAGEFATLLPPDGDAYLRVQRISDGPGGCHLDLHISLAEESLEDAAAEALALGGQVHVREDDQLIVVDSPGGFTFCFVPWDGETEVPAPLRTDGAGLSRAAQICLDVPPPEFEREASFWTALTGWERQPSPAAEYVFLQRPPGMPVSVLFQRRATAAPGDRVRGHVDIGCSDYPRMVQRHVAAGARVVDTFPWWTVMEDPVSRPYCLTMRHPMTGDCPPRGDPTA